MNLFSAKPDEDEYDIICKVTSQLELELETPDFEDLVVELIKVVFHLFLEIIHCNK